MTGEEIGDSERGLEKRDNPSGAQLPSEGWSL